MLRCTNFDFFKSSELIIYGSSDYLCTHSGRFEINLIICYCILTCNKENLLDVIFSQVEKITSYLCKFLRETSLMN